MKLKRIGVKDYYENDFNVFNLRKNCIAKVASDIK
jgi:hypothetical protein